MPDTCRLACREQGCPSARLRPLARKAKSRKPLDPSVRLVAGLASGAKVSEASTWKLSLNVPLEIDA